MALPDNYSYQAERQDQTRENTNAWVARFAPLVMREDIPTAKDVRDRLNLVGQLRQDGQALQSRLSDLNTDDDHTLATTFSNAYGQLDSVESDLRKTLARLAPVDSAGTPDLEQLNDKLAERKAREELGLPSEAIPEKLELLTSPTNWIQAGMLFLFSFGWLSFTSFHAYFMIGGMMKAFGFAALALLGFYAIFFAVGFGMLATAILSATNEKCTFEGHELRISRKIGPWNIQRKIQLSKVDPSIEVNPTQMRNSNAPPLRCIVMTDADGKPVRFASGVSEAQRIQFCEQIEAYLRAQPVT